MLCASPISPASANTVTLDDVLDTYDTVFRLAVHRVLRDEGFEVSCGFPELQLAREVRDAVGWELQRQGYVAAWSPSDDSWTGRIAMGSCWTWVHRMNE